MDLGLKGMRALVTGGTRGIGRAIAETLADEGAAVAFCARTEADVTRAAEEMSGRGGVVTGRCVDVSDRDGVRQWVGDTAAELGGLDKLDAYQLLTQVSECPLANVVDVNYSSVTKVRKSLLPAADAYGGMHRRLRELAGTAR